MKPFRGLMICGALAVWFAAADTASAAWNNVFQATIWHRNKPVQVQYHAVPVPVAAAPAPTAVYSAPVVAHSNPCDPCPQPCPQPQTVCSTSYVQRCYYQPITSYQTKTYYEPVTTYRTSYYYEPVTSYRYSCYFDPCTCSYKQVAVPTVSYSLKSKCCPVQSFVQKCAQVPVTSYQKCCYWEPQTTCCTTGPGTAPVYPSAPTAPPAAPPGVTEQTIPGSPPGNGTPPMHEKYYGPPMNEGSQTKSYGPPVNSNWQGNYPSLGTPQPALKPLSQPPAAPKTPIQFEKFTSLPGNSNSGVKGQVVSHTNAPRPNTQVIFENASHKGHQQAVTANASGQFNVSLTAGQWVVYIRQANGQPAYHSQIQINDNQPSYLTLVSK